MNCEWFLFGRAGHDVLPEQPESSPKPIEVIGRVLTNSKK
jgi:hypothetical protein